VLTKIRIRYISKRRVEVTLIPTKIGRWIGLEIRRGLAERAKNSEGEFFWWWATTDRYVGRRIERCIEAAPIPSIEEMPIELLLGEGDVP